MDNLHFLFAAFTAVWIVLFLYLMRLNRRTAEVGRQLEQLESKLADKENNTPDRQ